MQEKAVYMNNIHGKTIQCEKRKKYIAVLYIYAFLRALVCGEKVTRGYTLHWLTSNHS